MDSEKELVAKVIDGDEKAFNDLVRLYQKNIYWHSRRMVGNHFDADEVTQQVIIILYNKLSTFKFQSSLKTWIYRITQTICLNLIRKRRVRQFFSLDDGEVSGISQNEDIITNYEDKEKLENVNKALDKLPIKQREVFVLRHFEELSYDEIADITGKSIGGLKANYFHASKKIFGIINNESE